MRSAPSQEARFDRHFVRDLTWSRHQLEELANRRFMAAQRGARAEVSASGEGSDEFAPVVHLGTDDDPGTTFAKLFKQVWAWYGRFRGLRPGFLLRKA